MSSIIKGFTYDIFISYRQKDNKHNGWVTEFMNNLRNELGTIIKEDINIYSDINPGDGLLETHDVKASLEDKLRSLIFIPVLSRIYCDPLSYAWEHEFKAFIEMASNDRFGLKILLKNGNVASRVLPVKIYDLNDDDIRMVEQHLGIIRSVDFIYRSKGVNRPLSPWDDDVIKNTTQPFYRDQINKVANAIDEIISSLKDIQTSTERERKILKKQKSSDRFLDPAIFFSYNGPVDVNVMDVLLKKLKVTHEFEILNKPTRKKVYSILSECLDNIIKYSYKGTEEDETTLPYVSIAKQAGKIILKTGNLVENNKTDDLVKKLDSVNGLDEKNLRIKHDERMTAEVQEDSTPTGLGFIMIKLKSGNNIDYRVTKTDKELSFFEMQINIVQDVGKKLIIEQTGNSPRVFFDPENNVFEISGESRPADVPGFYRVIMKWLDEFTEDFVLSGKNDDQIIFNIDLEYFNSSSARYLHDFFKQLSIVRQKGKNISVRWTFEEDDTDLLEAGREFARLAGLPFEFIQKDSL
jgi:hypothetical protein